MQIYAQANYNNEEKLTFISRNEVLDTQRENKLTEKHFNTHGTILKLAVEMDSLARHRLTFTFVIKNLKKLLSGKFIKNHVYSYS